MAAPKNKETWELIPKSKGYSVSSFGRVRSPYKILSICQNEFGYSVVNISYKEQGIKTKRVHRLVAKAFIPNPENKRTVNHKDGDKTNNHISNLEWATYSENAQHSFDYLDRKPVINKGEKNGYSKKVINVSSGESYGSLKELYREVDTGYKYSTLRAMLNGQNPNKTNYRYVSST